LQIGANARRVTSHEKLVIKRITKMLAASLTVIAVIYLAALGLLFLKQEALIFHPEKWEYGALVNLPAVKEVWISVPGARLHGLHFQQRDAKGVIFFLHGNAGNAQSWLPDTELYEQTRYDVFMLDYRGYGKSTGKIESERQLHADVRAAWNAIAPHYQGKRNVIYGRSLGSGLAAYLAAETEPPVALVILVSPYKSLVSMSRELYPYVPGFLMRYPMRTDQIIKRIQSPVLLIHGTQDALISVAHARTLKNTVPRAALVEIVGASHNDIHDAADYRQTLIDYLSAL